MSRTDEGVRATRRFVAGSATGPAAVAAVGVGLAATLWFLSGPLVGLDVAVARAANDLVAPRRWLVAGLTAVTTHGADLTAALVLVTLAAARLYRGAHHLSDVLGRVLLTVPWLYALDRVLSAPARAPSPRPRSG